jgi:inhibitor of cysteine peptidase
VKLITEESNGTEINLAIGETFEVRLEENRSTGFKWVFESSSKVGEGVLSLVGDSFGKGEAVGQPGTHRWEFRAERAGSGTITLSYRRPWEGNASPARSFTLKVRVSE